MAETFSLIYFFLENYLSPLLFVIGLMYFIYGVIEYFIVGLGGDEGRAQNGREALLKSISWFVLALIVYGVIAFLGWLGSLSAQVGEPEIGQPRSSGDAGVNFNRSDALLGVPNVPRGNDE